MHELSLAQSVLEIIEESAQVQCFNRVRSVILEIGKLSSVDPDAMRFCFDAAMKGSLAEGARLDIVEMPGQGWCARCAREVTVVALYEPCPYCGDFQVRVTGGDAMRVKELEVE